MSKNLLKLKFILSLIDDIEYIVEKHNGVVNTINDREGKHALFMCIMQIGENLNKLETNNPYIIEAKKGAYNVRNFIAHDYEGINFAIRKHC
jgi:uncharacterized protein with HEPN domain